MRYSKKVAERAKAEGAGSVVISAKIEAEFAGLPPDDRAEFLAEMGLAEPGLNRLIRAGYTLLDLVTYFTAGPKEARAWTITRGTKASGRRPASSTPISRRASSAPRPSPMTTTWRSAARTAPRTPARCAWKARSTSSRTAT